MDLGLGLRRMDSDASMNYAFRNQFNALDAEGFRFGLVREVGGMSCLRVETASTVHTGLGE